MVMMVLLLQMLMMLMMMMMMVVLMTLMLSACAHFRYPVASMGISRCLTSKTWEDQAPVIMQ
jgi:hypothetical protein